MPARLRPVTPPGNRLRLRALLGRGRRTRRLLQGRLDTLRPCRGHPPLALPPSVGRSAYQGFASPTGLGPARSGSGQVRRWARTCRSTPKVTRAARHRGGGLGPLPLLHHAGHPGRPVRQRPAGRRAIPDLSHVVAPAMQNVCVSHAPGLNAARAASCTGDVASDDQDVTLPQDAGQLGDGDPCTAESPVVNPCVAYASTQQSTPAPAPPSKPRPHCPDDPQPSSRKPASAAARPDP